MSFRINLAKKLFIFGVFLCITSFGFSQNKKIESKFYAIVNNVTANSGSKPLLYYDNNPVEINPKDTIYAGSIILTNEKQRIEMVIYNEQKEIGIITIKENTDFRFQLNDLKTVLDVQVIYGSIRAVFDESILAVVNSQTIKTAIYGADFGLVSVSDDRGIRKGYAIVFGGELLLASQQDTENPETVKGMQICEFVDYTLSKPRYFKIEEYKEWKQNEEFKTQNIPTNLSPVLEKSDLKESEIPKEEKDLAREEQTQIANKEEEKKSKLAQILATLFSFKAGVLNYDRNIAMQLVHNPGVQLYGGKFQIGLYFSLNLIPSKTFTNQAILNINRSNNEWSFGSDQNGDVKAIVYDVFYDLFLKLDVIRYNHETDPVFVYAGNYNNVNDFLSYSLKDYNTSVFYPKFRKVSFINKVNLPWFESLLYAEDIMPSGLYGGDILFMTPSKSFRFKFRLSGYIDCYDLIKFNSQESFFPAQFNTTFNYDTFNVPSFGFSLFFAGGIYLPFSYNFQTGASLFQTLMTQNPSAIAANISGSTGFNLRIVHFSFNGSFIFDSGLNKIGLFDPLYTARRDNRSKVIRDWMISIASRPLDINDFNFGLQVQLGYQLPKYVALEINYKFTFPCYYDRFYFKLTLDSSDEWKINVAFFALWCLESIGLSFQNLKTFQENNLIFTGLTIRPHKSTEINLAFGVTPDYITYSDPWYSQFMLNLNITFKPFYAFIKK